jgi:hypothetical protein
MAVKTINPMSSKKSYNQLFLIITICYIVLYLELVVVGVYIENFKLGWILAVMVCNQLILRFITNLISLKITYKIQNLDIELFAKAKGRIRWTAILTTLFFANVFYNTFNESTKGVNITITLYSTWIIFGLGYRLWQLITGDFEGGERIKTNNDMLKFADNFMSKK